jgi:arabinogalactan endo-1,4-beta-galactosidase
MNTISPRVWVNPNDDKASGHCSKEETVVMALRAQKNGNAIMIDFHYSDSGQILQNNLNSKAWENHLCRIINDVYVILDVLMHKRQELTPEWVQVGNEIPGGMLWPEGSTKIGVN